MAEYGPYADAYTDKELDWYGLSEPEAKNKLRKELEAANQPAPLKHVYRQRLIEQLKAAPETGDVEVVISNDGKTVLDRKNE